MEIKDIRIRDPYVYLDKETGLYYIYGTTNLLEGLRAGDKFHCYTSHDLIHFDGPYVIFDSKKEGFWGTQDFWAAEYGEMTKNTAEWQSAVDGYLI